MIVVKIGGGEGINYDAILSDVAALDEETVIVHGGNSELTSLSRRLGKEPKMLHFASGNVSRYTDQETMELFEMVYCGKINSLLVEKLHKLGKNAFGLSGLDGGLLKGERKKELVVLEEGKRKVVRDDRSGNVVDVDSDLLTLLMEKGYLPVISPPALSEDNMAINVDGDRVAALIAAELGADALIILSSVPGLLKDLKDEGSLVAELSVSGMERVEHHAQGRMKIKLLAAKEALSGGVKRVILADARVQKPVSKALAGGGTHIVW